MSEPVPEEPLTHIYLPQLTPAGDLPLYAEVTVEHNGTRYAGPLSGDLNADIPVRNPAMFQPGIIDLWAEEPMRVNLQVSTPDTSYVLLGVDFWPHPANQVRTDSPVMVKDDTPPEPWKLLKYEPDGGTFVVFDPLASKTHHDGIADGSTVVSPGDRTWDDEDAQQTWIGWESGNAGTPMEGSTALGALADPYGQAAVTVGYNSRAYQFGAIVADQGTALGYYNQVGRNSVTFGNKFTIFGGVDDTADQYLAPESVIAGSAHSGYNNTQANGDLATDVVALGFNHVVSLAQGVPGQPSVYSLGQAVVLAISPSETSLEERFLAAGTVILGNRKGLASLSALSRDQMLAPRVTIGSYDNAAIDWRFGYTATERLSYIGLRGAEVVVPGTLQAQDSTVLAGNGKTLSFFGTTGTTKKTITDNNANASVTALLNAFQSMGLLTRA